MTLELHVALLSDAAPGSGAGGPLVDRDVVVDESGLPVLPGRRLKGLLRETCQEVQEAFQVAGRGQWAAAELCSTDELFGTAQKAGLVGVADARLAGSAHADGATGVAASVELAEWFGWAAGQGGYFASAPVLDQMTVVRSQTAINAETGAAQRGALRSMRMLRRGLRFAGAMRLEAADPALELRARRTLALAAAALRRLGTARQRGAGRVQARLWDGGTDLTEAALGEVAGSLAGKGRR
jgi:CRISPR/Cas system CSM-associated protein Csm3 (group 7 of RAMP superfamily)